MAYLFHVANNIDLNAIMPQIIVHFFEEESNRVY